MFKLTKSRLIFLSAAVFFLAVSGILAWQEARSSTFLVYGFLPALLAAFLSFGAIRLQTAIVTASVVLGLWLAHEFRGTDEEFPPLYYFMAIVATVIGFKLAGIATVWWAQNVEKDDPASPTSGS